MLDIPAGAAAREAWNALPGTVRAEVAALAERGEAHPDPVIAAIVVGTLRHSSSRSLWTDSLLLATLFTFGGGLWLGLFMLGGEIHRVGWRDYPISATFATAVLIFLGSAGISRLLGREKPAAPPVEALTPSLRALLLLPQALTTPQPMTIRRQHPYLPIALATLPFAVTYGYLLARWTGRPLDPIGGAQFLLFQAAVGAVVSAILRYAHRAERRVRREAPMPIRLIDAGLRFGRGRTIPWSHVQGVYVTADTLEWVLRDRPRLVLDFDATRTHPEDIVLAARAYSMTAAVETIS